MKKLFSLEFISSTAARFAWQFVAVWIVVLVLAGYATTRYLGDALTTSQEFTSKPESQIAGELLGEHFGKAGSAEPTEFVLVHALKNDTVPSPAFQQFTEALVGELRTNPSVGQVVSFYEVAVPTLVALDQKALLVPFSLKGNLAEQERAIESVVHFVQERRTSDFDVRVTGPVTISQNFTEISERDLQKGEMIGLPITLVILAVVFGALVAALVPLFLAVVAIACAVGLTALLGSQINPFSFFVINMITMMGLAVGIDYSLFIVSRFREERLKGVAPDRAIVRAGTTAGRAVLFSGLTVVLALVGLYLVPMNIFQGLASGAILVVLFAVAAALTLLPALLALLGDRINLGRIGRGRTAVDERGGFWDQLTEKVMARPLLSLFGAVALMGLLAYPALDLRIGASGISSMPTHLEARQAYDLLKQEFAVGLVSPATLVIEGDATASATQSSIEKFRAALAARPEFGPSLVIPGDTVGYSAVRFPLNADATSQKAEELVTELRETIVPAAFADSNVRAYLGGEAANNHDFIQLARDNTAGVFFFVLGLSFILLMVVFRSIVVPIKALIMNLLSVAAAYGLLVVVFQKGVGNEWFGFSQVEKIEAWLPLFLFCVLFGLSMDYHVFLLSRIRERFMQTGDNAESVAFGVRTTASLITGAALIMVAVFAAFASGDLVMFQQMGFGMAVAILLDATIIRSLLVPASMRLLGERNWYLPPWVRWLPNISVEGEHDEPRKTAGRPGRRRA